ncbi:hypothetical protein J3R75_003843 [Oligosphaera ethanolica]|uniref:Uncharacterized protein n=1 Tax=Oligosphaera ethanolica TaxID=760260 RepID=A0AAE3VK05_9BACT|nr:hypothetical protein [Oligosphaera ethanolica]
MKAVLTGKSCLGPFRIAFRQSRSGWKPLCARLVQRGRDGPGTVGVDDEDGLMSRLVGVGETPTPRPRDEIGKEPPRRGKHRVVTDR